MQSTGLSVPIDINILTQLTSEKAINLSTYKTKSEVNIRISNIPITNTALTRGQIVLVKKLHRVPPLFTYNTDIIQMLVDKGINKGRVKMHDNVIDYYVCRNIPQPKSIRKYISKGRLFKNGRLINEHN